MYQYHTNSLVDVTPLWYLVEKHARRIYFFYFKGYLKGNEGERVSVMSPDSTSRKESSVN
jgi:hypothetical protein